MIFPVSIKLVQKVDYNIILKRGGYDYNMFFKRSLLATFKSKYFTETYKLKRSDLDIYIYCMMLLSSDARTITKPNVRANSLEKKKIKKSDSFK